MFCKNCGSAIPKESKNCVICCQPLPPNEEIKEQRTDDTFEIPISEHKEIDTQTEIPEDFVHNENEVKNPNDNIDNGNDTEKNTTQITEENPQKPKSTKKILIGISATIIVALLSLIIGIHSLSKAEPSYSAELVFTSNGSESGKLTEKQKKVRELMTEDILQLVEKIVVRDFYLPDTTKIKHDKSSWNIDNSLFTFGGTVTYLNKEGKEETETFIMKAFVGKKATLGVYGKLGKRELYDNQHEINTLGSQVLKESNRMELTPLLGELFSINDEEYQKVTLEEFRRIKAGMSYAEVTEIIGSLGTFVEETEKDKIIYAWVGNGNKDSKATITFTDKEVYKTEQVGLK